MFSNVNSANPTYSVGLVGNYSFYTLLQSRVITSKVLYVFVIGGDSMIVIKIDYVLASPSKLSSKSSPQNYYCLSINALT